MFLMRYIGNYVNAYCLILKRNLDFLQKRFIMLIPGHWQIRTKIYCLSLIRRLKRMKRTEQNVLINFNWSLCRGRNLQLFLYLWSKLHETGNPKIILILKFFVSIKDQSVIAIFLFEKQKHKKLMAKSRRNIFWSCHH